MKYIYLKKLEEKTLIDYRYLYFITEDKNLDLNNLDFNPKNELHFKINNLDPVEITQSPSFPFPNLLGSVVVSIVKSNLLEKEFLCIEISENNQVKSHRVLA